MRAIRKRLAVLQARGAKYDEIVTRSEPGVGTARARSSSRSAARLDVALSLARETGTFNVLLEFLEYDRSIVQDALGDSAGARARLPSLPAARRSVHNRNTALQSWRSSLRSAKAAARGRIFKRADQLVADNIAGSFTVAELAAHCGVSWRTLEKAFTDSRRHAGRARPQSAARSCAAARSTKGSSTISEIAARCGFRSSTTFALEYRKRFGVPAEPRAARVEIQLRTARPARRPLVARPPRRL